MTPSYASVRSAGPRLVGQRPGVAGVRRLAVGIDLRRPDAERARRPAPEDLAPDRVVVPAVPAALDRVRRRLVGVAEAAPLDREVDLVVGDLELRAGLAGRLPPDAEVAD